MVVYQSGSEVDLPDRCPNCDRELNRNGRTRSYRAETGESSYGEYLQIECVGCDIVIKRQYESAEVPPDSDPFVDPTQWVYRAESLRVGTVLKRREAQVQSLKETGRTHAEIAGKLDVSESTVGEYSRRIATRTEEASQTLSEIGQSVDPLVTIEGQFNELSIHLLSEYSCPECGESLNRGDDAAVAAERVSSQWEVLEIYCDECSRDEYTVFRNGSRKSLTEVFEQNQESILTSALVEGVLGSQNEIIETPPDSQDHHDSLTLRSPHVREVWN